MRLCLNSPLSPAVQLSRVSTTECGQEDADHGSAAPHTARRRSAEAMMTSSNGSNALAPLQPPCERAMLSRRSRVPAFFHLSVGDTLLSS